jgi:dienelactone hydrolase
MKNIFSAIVSAILIFFLTSPVLSAEEEFPSGQWTPRVQCKKNPASTYCLYIPKSWDRKKPTCVIYCFDPDAQGMRIAGMFSGSAEKYGWIVAGSNHFKNAANNGQIINDAIQNIYEDTHERFKIKPGGCYSTGFSGGAGCAVIMAESCDSDPFGGVITMAAATNFAKDPITGLNKATAVYFIIGNKDAVPNVKQRAAELEKLGNKTHVEVFSGGHQLPGGGLAAKAVDWMMEIRNEKERAEALAQAEELLKKKMPAEAVELLADIQKRFPQSKEAEAVKKRLKEIGEDKNLKDELDAGKMFLKAMELAENPKTAKKAVPELKKVVEKYPNTEYAKRATEEIKKLEGGGEKPTDGDKKDDGSGESGKKEEKPPKEEKPDGG